MPRAEQILGNAFRAAPPGCDRDPLHESPVDVVGIGGGYPGLGCALELARGGATESMLDADAPSSISSM